MAKDQVEIAKEAMRLRLAADEEEMSARPENGQHADEGMNAIPRDDQPPSGAFDVEGQRPVLERSRKTR
jgi:hypothetical protein